MIELKKIYRQDDNIFVNILNAVRENALTVDHLEHLNSRLHPPFNKTNKDGYITLTTHNAQADEINTLQINQLNEAKHLFKASIKGDFPESMYPAEEQMILKKGAQVMFLKNDTEEKNTLMVKLEKLESLSEMKFSFDVKMKTNLF